MMGWFKRLTMGCKFKYIYTGAMIVVFASILLLVVSLIVMLWPTKVIEVRNFEVYEAVGGNRTMKAYTIPAGGELEFDVEFTKYIDATAQVTVLLKQIDNGFIHPYPETKTTRMPIGHHTYKGAIVIPRTTPPGKYVFIRSYRHFVNPLRTTELVITSNVIEVTAPATPQIVIIEEGNKISMQNQRKLDKIEDRLKVLEKK